MSWRALALLGLGLLPAACGSRGNAPIVRYPCEQEGRASAAEPPPGERPFTSPARTRAADPGLAIAGGVLMGVGTTISVPAMTLGIVGQASCERGPDPGMCGVFILAAVGWIPMVVLGAVGGGMMAAGLKRVPHRGPCAARLEGPFALRFC